MGKKNNIKEIVDNSMYWKQGKFGGFICSHCGGKMDFKFPFCPFCGKEASNPFFDSELEEDEDE